MKLLTRLVAVLALFAAVPAHADLAWFGPGYKLYPILVPPTNCTGTGSPCLWYKTGVGFMTHNIDGTDSVLGGLPSLAGVQGAVLVEDPVGTLIFRQLTTDDLGTAFAVTLARNGFSATLEIGNTIVNPQFTDTHNQTPSAASLADFNSTCTLSPATATALGYGGAAATCSAKTYSYPGSLNATRSWTYSATYSGTTRTASVSAQWEPLVYYGMAAVGTYNAAYITGLSTSGLSASTGRTISYAAGGNTLQACYAIPSSYTAPVSFVDTVTHFGIPYSRVAAAVSVTNAFSVAVNYDLYCTDNLLNLAFSGQWS